MEIRRWWRCRKPNHCSLRKRTTEISTIGTSLPKVIWEEGRVAALSHTYAVKSPLVTMASPKFAPKSTLSRGPIPKPHYLPHPWTRPTYDAKRHPDPIRRFSTMHWTDRQNDRRTTDRSSTGKFDDYIYSTLFITAEVIAKTTINKQQTNKENQTRIQQ